MKNAICGITLSLLCSSVAFAAGASTETSTCLIPAPTVEAIQAKLAAATISGNGGLFTPNRMWSAIVDRKGQICSVTNNNPDAWPGSRAIAIAKAETANYFSNNMLALSTANLYGPTQPGGSLYGLNNSNPFNPAYNAQGSLNASSSEVASTEEIGGSQPIVPGGIITFGGGVALYQSKQVIGGLGVSGDTSCADHAVAYTMRKLAGFNGIPAGVNNNTDNIAYYPYNTLSGEINPALFDQPHCLASDITPTP
jgi:uncharacterized protein GlcG (DUF336 family)